MNKIKLDLDMLDVESFGTQTATPSPGTIQGYQDSFYEGCSAASGPCVESEFCTYDPLNRLCYDSVHYYCAETNLRPCSTTESGNTDC